MSDFSPYRGWFWLLVASLLVLLLYRSCERPAEAQPEARPQKTTAPGPLVTSNDPLQRCARKALAGAFGILKPWQRDAYQWAIAKGITVPAGNKTKLTSYGKWEPCGTHCYSGDPFSLEFVSVPKKYIPLGAIVWTPWGLRYAMDTGGAVKARKPYIRPPENMNLDYATAREQDTKRDMPWVIVKRHTSWNWYGERKWGNWSKQGQR